MDEEIINEDPAVEPEAEEIEPAVEPEVEPEPVTQVTKGIDIDALSDYEATALAIELAKKKPGVFGQPQTSEPEQEEDDNIYSGLAKFNSVEQLAEAIEQKIVTKQARVTQAKTAVEVEAIKILQAKGVQDADNIVRQYTNQYDPLAVAQANPIAVANTAFGEFSLSGTKAPDTRTQPSAPNGARATTARYDKRIEGFIEGYMSSFKASRDEAIQALREDGAPI